MGDPAEAMAWLANKLATHGSKLEAGEIVISGSLIVPVQPEKGDRFEAVFEGLGGVSVNFI